MTGDTQVKQKRKVEWAEKEGEEGAEEEEEEEEGEEEAAETKSKRKKNLVRVERIHIDFCSFPMSAF